MTKNDMVVRWCPSPAELEAFRRDLDALGDAIAAKTRAAVLAEEERRVWCERYTRERDGGWSEDIAAKWADASLTHYREARAALSRAGKGD